MLKTTRVKFNVYPHEDNSGDWVVEISDAEVPTVIFSGENAQQRAESYADSQVRGLLATLQKFIR